MKKLETISEHNFNHYLNYILEFIHLPIEDFIQRIKSKDHYCYEKTIYIWSVKLFHKGYTADEALQIIQKARMLFLLRKPKKNKHYQFSSHEIQKILDMLKTHPAYNRLDLIEKGEVRKKLSTLLKDNHPIEEIENYLETLKPSAPKISRFKRFLQCLKSKLSVPRLLL